MRSHAQLAAFFTIAVPHELGHSLGVQHHGDELEPASQVISESGTARVYDLNGALLSKPITLTGPIGTKGGPASGDPACFMAYPTSMYRWAHHPEANAYYQIDPSSSPAQTRFCATPAGSSVNAPAHRPAPYFGDATRGNCVAKMRIRDY